MTMEIFNKIHTDLSHQAERKIIKFSVGKVHCGVDIMSVREIVNPTSYTPLPNAPAFVIGAADHRTAIVPIIDMRVRLGLPLPETSNVKKKWIIVAVLGKSVALLVDSVHGVISVNQQQERPREPLESSSDVSWVNRVYGGDTQLLFELNLNNITDGAELFTEDGYPMTDIKV